MSYPDSTPTAGKSKLNPLWIVFGFLVVAGIVILIIYLVTSKGKSGGGGKPVPFCPDVNNALFNPNGCETHTTTQTCLSSINPGYNADSSACGPTGTCTGTTGRDAGCSCTLNSNCANGSCVVGKCAVPPSPIPVGPTCMGTTGLANGCSCTLDSNCLSAFCMLGTCQTAPSALGT